MDASALDASRTTCVAIGADAGGTKIAIAWSDGTNTHSFEAPSMNLRTSTPDAFGEYVADQILLALDGTMFSDDAHLCVGAAGAGTPAIAEACREALARHLSLPLDRVRVVADAQIALEAGFPEGKGILIIAGTGSGCYALGADDALIRAGGWGPGLEDPGSGSELGRSAVKHLLACLESGELDVLSRRVAETMGMQRPSISGVLDTYYRPDYHASSLAPAILDLFEAGDTAAIELIENQCAALARQCQRLMRVISKDAPIPMAVAGGLANRPSYIRALSRAVTAVIPDAHVERLKRPPVEGALSWALDRLESAV